MFEHDGPAIVASITLALGAAALLGWVACLVVGLMV